MGFEGLFEDFVVVGGEDGGLEDYVADVEG